MSTNLEDYVELLNAEQHVQVDKLREHARHGIAPRVRGEVWLYLLGVLSSDKTTEISSLLEMNQSYRHLASSLPSGTTSLILKTALQHHLHRFSNPTYASLISSITAEPTTAANGQVAVSAPGSTTSGNADAVKPSSGMTKSTSQMALSSSAPKAASAVSTGPDTPGGEHDPLTLRAQYMRLLPPPPSAPLTRHGYLSTLTEVLGRYYAAHYPLDAGLAELDLGDEPKAWVYLATPFCCCFSRPIAVYLAFEALMDRIRHFPPMPSRLASLLTLFRLSMPDLFEYFEDEQINYIAVAQSWLTTMLGKELWLADVLRLWDAYLASDDMFELHCYVCVAILGTCRETLEELDSSEAKLMLLDLPPMDVDRLLQDAANLKVQFPLPRPVDDA